VLRSTVVYRPVGADTGGRFEANPAFAAGFAALGIDSAAGFLELPGEVVSGHPDRHVVRVQLPGFPCVFYLKRQHAVGWRERLRNRLAGFGWASRCEREVAILKQLRAAGLPAPQWAAFGRDDRGRAFLLIAEAAGADLRQVLSDTELSLGGRRQFATHLGRLIALLHASGFTTPDLTAKHILVSASTGETTLIDWQSTRRVMIVQMVDRLRSFAALHASVADQLVSVRDRLRLLRAALAPARKAGLVTGRFSELARQVEAEAVKLRDRRSIRDQRQPVVTASPQRLVWVAGEAVCAVPDVAASWPKEAIAEPFYGCEPGTLTHRMPDGREATLSRGRSFAPLSRLASRLRGRPWRSPGVTLGRVLFHLERYGIAAPRLLAFGQRFTGFASAEWFALHTQATESLPILIDASTAEQLGRLLRQLHDSGCRPLGDSLTVFGRTASSVGVRDVTMVRLTKRMSQGDREHDLAELLASLALASRSAAEAGYRNAMGSHSHGPTNRAAAPVPRSSPASVS
jgi:tRNA A-37 threonylcarbamoyl transferase component Bud32